MVSSSLPPAKVDNHLALRHKESLLHVGTGAIRFRRHSLDGRTPVTASNNASFGEQLAKAIRNELLED
jgi:hypothetical protein